MLDQVNRISDLPNCITSNILSRLTTKEAVRSCILSKDWKYRWISVYNLYFDDETKLLEHYGLVDCFCNFVDKVLHNFLISNHNIQTVCFDLKFHNYDPRRVSRWISNVFSLHVKNLRVTALSARVHVVLPGEIENLSPLSELSLVLDFVWEVRINNYFPNLKRLFLFGGDSQFQIVNMQSPNIGQLSLTFPVLEILELDRFRFVNANSVEITVPELVSFAAYNTNNYYSISYVIKILAPKLVKFEVFPLYGTYVLCTPSLRQATLLHYDEPTKGFALRANTILAAGARSLKNLHLSGSVVKAIIKWEVLPTFDLLKQLMLYDSISGEDLWAFLKVIPCLESLTISKIKGQKGRYKKLEGSLPVTQLKRVVFLDFYGQDHETSLANFFLENATELEQVVLYLSERRYGSYIRRRWLTTLGPERSSRLNIVQPPK